MVLSPARSDRHISFVVDVFVCFPDSFSKIPNDDNRNYLLYIKGGIKSALNFCFKNKILEGCKEREPLQWAILSWAPWSAWKSPCNQSRSCFPSLDPCILSEGSCLHQRNPSHYQRHNIQPEFLHLKNNLYLNYLVIVDLFNYFFLNPSQNTCGSFIVRRIIDELVESII